jgi:predicted NBD/HSP70 family sugar kinase
MAVEQIVEVACPKTACWERTGSNPTAVREIALYGSLDDVQSA